MVIFMIMILYTKMVWFHYLLWFIYRIWFNLYEWFLKWLWFLCIRKSFCIHGFINKYESLYGMVIFCAVILYCSSGFFGYINHFIFHGCIASYNSFISCDYLLWMNRLFCMDCINSNDSFIQNKFSYVINHSSFMITKQL